MDDFTQGFWREYQRFLKMPLVTELPNPETLRLSELAQQDVVGALRLLFSLDEKVVLQFKNKILELREFKRALALQLAQHRRVLLVGCGASARMAAQIEYLWRLDNPGSMLVQAVIAGGDVALIEAVERCEDEPSYAIRHLQSLGLNEKDLVIGLSASGESPFVLQAMQSAMEVCEVQPWLLFCNPQEILLARSPLHVLNDARCCGLGLCVGEMALTGSTRMQATTMMTLALLSAFFGIDDELDLFYRALKSLPFDALAKFANFEIEAYREKNYLLYHVDDVYGLSALADTTERSPTFNVPVFEIEGREPALAYVVLNDEETQASAWRNLLLRDVQSLNWAELMQTSDYYLAQFDLSSSYGVLREVRVRPHALEHVFIKAQADIMLIEYAQVKVALDVSGLSVSMRQLLLRLVLVNHSTCVFGALGFYQGNLMTYVKPSNYKLVDRVVRYILFLARERYQLDLDYKEIAEMVLRLRGTLDANVSVTEMILRFKV